MATFRRIQRQAMMILERFRRQLSTSKVGRNDFEADGRIQDGVDYSLPVILPQWMRKSLNQQQLTEYLENANTAPYRNQFSSPYKTDLPFMPVTEDPLREWSFQTRERILTNCHAAYERNPIANAGVEYSADFIIGDGFNLNCKNTQISDLLYEFIDNPENSIREYERQAAIDLQVDGELFLRKFAGKSEDGTGGQIRVIPLRPWECQYIKTKEGDFKTRESYNFQFNASYGDDPIQTGGTKEENVPADEIIHVAINRHAYELRGRPDVYKVLAWLRAYGEYLEGRSQQNKWRNSLLWWAKVANATASTIAEVSAAFAKPPQPGTILTTSDRVELTALNGGGGSDSMEDGMAIKNMSATGFRLPAYFFADGSDANLATATAQQMPALTRFSAYQRTLTEQLWYPLFRSVIQSAIDAGILPEDVEEQDEDGEAIKEDPPIDQKPQMKTVTPGSKDGANPGMQLPVPKVPEGKPKTIKAIDAFEVEYEPVSAENPKDLADMLSVAVTNEWASNQTASAKLGFDYYREKKLIARERQQQQTEMAAGMRPIPPEMMRPEAMPAGKPPQGANGNGKQPAKSGEGY